MDSEAIAELECLAHAAIEAAESSGPPRETEASTTYELLRAWAWTMKQSQGWAQPEEFDALFPTLRAHARSTRSTISTEPTPPNGDSGDPRCSFYSFSSPAWTTGLLRAQTPDDEAAAGLERPLPLTRAARMPRVARARRRGSYVTRGRAPRM